MTEVVDFILDLMDERDYRARFTSNRSKVWRRWKLRLGVLAITVGIVASTINAVQSFQ